MPAFLLGAVVISFVSHPALFSNMNASASGRCGAFTNKTAVYVRLINIEGTLSHHLCVLQGLFAPSLSVSGPSSLGHQVSFSSVLNYSEVKPTFMRCLRNRNFGHPNNTIADSPFNSRFPNAYNQVTGNLAYRIAELHEEYGPIVRTAPNELSYIIDAWQDIYGRPPPRNKELTKDASQFVRPPNGVFGPLMEPSDKEHARMRYEKEF